MSGQYAGSFSCLALSRRTISDNINELETMFMAKDNRAEIKTNDISKLYVKVETDVSDAVKGFKALQREIRETTKALREYEAVSKRVNGDE